MAIQENLAGCGPDGTEAVGMIVKDILGVYYVVTADGPVEIPESVALSLNAVIVNLIAPVTIPGANLGDPLLVLTTNPGDGDDYVYDVYLQNKVTTTDATPTLIHAIPIGLAKVSTYSALVTAHRTGGDGSDDDGAGWQVQFVARNTGGTATLIGSIVTPTGMDQAWDVTVAAGGANIEISVVGSSHGNISWFISGHWLNAGV